LGRDHFETFRAEAEATRDGQGLPRFVEREFRDFLTCGCLAAGFARFRCASCRKDRLVPFSCKGRGFCPSCGGRRMTYRAAHLVDHVFPRVPVRQWVLSLPPRLRYLLAFDHALCRAVVAIFVRAVLAWLRRRAQRAGVAGGRGGGVAIVQRFGAALNLKGNRLSALSGGAGCPGPTSDKGDYVTRRPLMRTINTLPPPAFLAFVAAATAVYLLLVEAAKRRLMKRA
jgi:hypothetical protein